MPNLEWVKRLPNQTTTWDSQTHRNLYAEQMADRWVADYGRVVLLQHEYYNKLRVNGMLDFIENQIGQTIDTTKIGSVSQTAGGWSVHLFPPIHNYSGEWNMVTIKLVRQSLHNPQVQESVGVVLSEDNKVKIYGYEVTMLEGQLAKFSQGCCFFETAFSQALAKPMKRVIEVSKM